MQRVFAKAKAEMLNHNQAVKSGLPKDTRVHFLTFANTDFMQPTRIVDEAKEFGFASITAMNEYDIPDVVERHRDIIQNNNQGYGLWIWKPSVILKRLQTIAEGDILVYCDAGMHLNHRGIMRYYDYLHKLITYDMIAFSLTSAYKAQHYVKRDAIDAYFPEFANQLSTYHYAGVLMMKNTPDTRKILTDWFTLCETHHFIDRSSSVAPELPIFQGNDCDNGLLNMCLAKYSQNVFSVDPHETNLYHLNGTQVQRASEEEWERLRLCPFQVRRLRPH